MLRFLYISLILLYVFPSFGQSPQVLLPAKKGDLWGFINEQGNWVIPAKYDYCTAFGDRSYTAVSDNHKSLLINRKGEIITTIEPTDIVAIYGNSIVFRENSRYGWVDRVTRVTVSAVFRKLEYIAAQNTFIGSLDTSQQLLDTQGKVLIDNAHIQYDDQFYYTYTDNGNGLYSSSGEEILAPYAVRIVRKMDYFIVLDTLSNMHVYTPKGVDMFSGNYDDINPLGGDYFELRRKNKRYLAQGSVIVDSLADFYQRFRSLDIVYKEMSGYGVFSSSMKKRIIDPVYTQIYSLSGSNYTMTQNGYLYELFDSNGVKLTSQEYQLIQGYKDGVSIVQNDGLFGLLDKEAKEILPCRFTYLNVGSDGVIKARERTSLFLFEIDDNQRIVDSLKFTNTAVVNLGGKVELNAKNGGVSSQTINSLWYQNAKGKWGLKKPSGEIAIKPLYDAVYKIKNSPLVIGKIFANKTQRMGKRVSLTARGSYGVVNETTQKASVLTGLLYVDTAGVADSSVQVFRVMTGSGYMATINKYTGKVLRYPSKYIGNFRKGYAKIFIGTKIILTSKPKFSVIATILGYASEFGLTIQNNTFALRSTVLDGYGYWTYLGPDGKDIANRFYMKSLRIKSCDDFSNNRAIIMNVDSSYGMIDQNGSLILDLSYKKVSFLRGTRDSLVLTEAFRKKYGYVSDQGVALTGVQYTKALPFVDTRTWCFTDNTTTLLHKSGKAVTFEGKQKVAPFSNGIGGIASDRRMALVDSNGLLLTDEGYLKVGKYSEGLIPVKRKSTYSYVAEDGEVEIATTYKFAGPFIDGVARVKIRALGRNRHSYYSYINIENKRINKYQFTKAQDINEHQYAEVRVNSKRGVVNAQGKTIIKPRYRKIYFGDDRFTCYGKNTTTIYDFSGKKVKTIRASYVKSGYSDGLQVVRKFKRYGAIDSDGEKVLGYKYSKLTPFDDGITAINKGRRVVVLTREGDTLAHAVGRCVGGFSDGVLLVKRNSNYVYINAYGQDLFDQRFTDAQPFKNGLAVVALKGKYGLMNEKGFFSIYPAYSKVDYPQNGVSIVGLSSVFGVCDLNTNYIVSLDCTSVKYLPSENLYQYQFKNQYGYFTKTGEMIWKVK